MSPDDDQQYISDEKLGTTYTKLIGVKCRELMDNLFCAQQYIQLGNKGSEKRLRYFVGPLRCVHQDRSYNVS